MRDKREFDGFSDSGFRIFDEEPVQDIVVQPGCTSFRDFKDHILGGE
jgi:hypothetical protein